MKITKIAIMLIIILNITYVTTFAFSLSDVLTGAKTFLTNAKNAAAGNNIDDELSDTIKGLASAGLAIGTVIAICAGVVIGINTMATGSIGKANLKEALTPYIIGCVVLFAAWGIWAAVVKTMESAFGE